MRSYRNILLLVFLLTTTGTLRAQSGEPLIDPLTAGRHYLLAFPDTLHAYIDTADLRLRPWKDTIAIALYAGVDTRATVTGPGGWIRTVNLRAGEPQTIVLNDESAGASRVVCDVSGQVQQDVFEVQAEEPVVVYCWMITRYGAEAWTPVPVEHWGQEYRAITGLPPWVRSRVQEYGRRISGGREYRDCLVYYNDIAPGFILVIASENNTHVRIEPPDSVERDGSPLEVTLQAGECYQILMGSVPVNNAESVPIRRCEISGTRISADHPIGVINGIQRIYHVSDRTTSTWLQSAFLIYADATRQPGAHGIGRGTLLAEWLTPIQQHGRTFATALLDWDTAHYQAEGVYDVYNHHLRVTVGATGALQATARLDGYRWRDDSLTVSYEDTLRTLGVTQGPLRIKLPGTSATVIHADQPLQVLASSAHSQGGYSSSADATYEPSESGVLVTPHEQWTSFAPVILPSLSWDTTAFYKVMVVTDSASRNNIVDDRGQVFPFHGLALSDSAILLGWMEYRPGEVRYLRGLNGARFGGVVYGSTLSVQGALNDIYKPVDSVRNLEGNLQIGYAYPLTARRTDLTADSPDRVRPSTGISLRNLESTADGIAITMEGVSSGGVIAAEMVDALGRRIAYREQVSFGLGEERVQLQTGSIPSGTYLLRVMVDGVWIGTFQAALAQ